jgi:hypothetical protein
MSLPSMLQNRLAARTGGDAISSVQRRSNQSVMENNMTTKEYDESSANETNGFSGVGGHLLASTASTTPAMGAHKKRPTTRR